MELLTEEVSCEFGSNKYYALCGFGGILSCGITHTAVVPLDLVKCRIQVAPEKYGNVVKGFRVSVKEGGAVELTKGWAPTLIGYSMQGLCKFGFYEVFKIFYGNLIGEVRQKSFNDSTCYNNCKHLTLLILTLLCFCQTLRLLPPIKLVAMIYMYITCS